ELFGGQEQEFDIARGLLQLDAAAVSALENRIEVIRHDRLACPPRDDPRKLARHRYANREWGIALPVEGRNQRRNIILGLRDVHAGQADALGATGVGIQPVESALKELRELGQAAGRAVEQTIEPRQPERGDLAAINAAPEELGRQTVIGNSATKPKRLEPGLPEELRHLGMVPERVQQPRHGDFDAEMLAAIPLSILHLPNEQFTARFDYIRHHVHSANEL